MSKTKPSGRAGKSHGYLCDRDPRIAGKTKGVARSKVKQLIQHAVHHRYAHSRPPGPFLPHHQGHAISTVMLGVGAHNVRNLGRWYQQVGST